VYPGRGYVQAVIFLLACAVDADSPPPAAPFPYRYTPEADLEPYELVRVETETWRPLEDTEETALYAQKSVLHKKGAPEESLVHFAAMPAQLPPLGEGVRLSFAGDAMWVGGNWAHVFDPVAPLFDGDLRALNLETPTTPNQSTEKFALGTYSFNSDPAYLDGLPADLVQVNNNHTLDAGEQGLTDTLAEIDGRRVSRTGVDEHVTLDVAGRRIAFLSFTWGINQAVVPERELFIGPFGHDGEVELTPALDRIAAAAATADHVVVMPHWGYEYEYYPDPRFMVQARAMIAAGADLVVGSGPHVVQPAELCEVGPDVEVGDGIGTCRVPADGPARTAAVLYSLGNAATTMATLPCQVGLLATVSLGERGVTGLGWAPLVSHDAVPEVRPLDEADVDEAAELARLTAHIGGGWRR
jgi:poly-gamma-glutamate synthesis protein (capsule biosynthesis protein)